MRKTSSFLLVILIGIAGCGQSSEPRPDGSAVSCSAPSDCGAGQVCCVSYTANGGGSASSECVAADNCGVDQAVDGGKSIACTKDADCLTTGYDAGGKGAGQLSCCPPDKFTPFSGKLCTDTGGRGC